MAVSETAAAATGGCIRLRENLRSSVAHLDDVLAEGVLWRRNILGERATKAKGDKLTCSRQYCMRFSRSRSR
jgi:hypothetical protein